MTPAPASALSSLRAELPALAIAVGFAPPREREAVSALLLLWMELRRAGAASETLLAATRMAWWRDTLRDGGTGGVPLAGSLVALGLAGALAEAIDAMVARLAGGDRPEQLHEGIAAVLASSTGVGEARAESLLVQLDRAFGGEAAGPERIGHPALDMVQWCCRKPSRLEYPDRHPMLALQMLWASIRR